MMKIKGFTLVEIAIVIAVGALLLVGISQAPRIIANNKANAEVAELPQIIAGIQRVYANHASYTDATLAAVIGLNGLPKERVIEGTSTAANRWGGAITMTPSTQFNTNDSVDLVYSGVPSVECTKVIPEIENQFRSVTVAGINVKPVGGQLDMDNLVAGCNSADKVTIIYRVAK